MLTRNIEVEVDITPKELAIEFCEMDGRQQAIFFNEIARQVSNFWFVSFVMQLQNITDSPDLTDEGRNIMRNIGDYAEKSVLNK